MTKINNAFYEELGEDWYHTQEHPIALLRAEGSVKNPWIRERLQTLSQHNITLLDVGCGAGFFTNDLAQHCPNYEIHGLDISPSTLETAKKFDATGKVIYSQGSAFSLPYDDCVFSAVTCLGFLEHVEDPAVVIQEISRVLKPGGLFFFQTFNRTWLANLLVIRCVEWFVKNTPRNLHVLNLFVRPSELAYYAAEADMRLCEITGLAPRLFTGGVLRGLFTGRVPEDFSFKLTRSLRLSYLGYCRKIFQPRIIK